MKTHGRLIFAVSMVTVAGLSAYAFAVEPEQRAVLALLSAQTTGTDTTCPPGACTIVFKTERGGPPSPRIDVR
jgi:hypothetical protein